MASTTDKTAPKLVSSTPKTGSSAVPVSDDLVLMFSESVKAGTGDIILSDGKDIRKIAITDPQVTISGNTVTINPTADLLSNGNHYSVKIAATAIRDLADNKYGGINNKTTFTFDTVDTTAPTLTITTPGNGHKLVSVNRNIDFLFNEKIQIGTTGNLVLSNGTDVRTVPITDPQITVKGTKITFNPTDDFSTGSTYNVKLDAGVVTDMAGNVFAGNGDGFNFSTQYAPLPDTKAPTLAQSSPKDNATAVAVDAPIKLIFNETIQAGTGNLVISNGSDIRTIAISDATQVTVNHNVLLINPAIDLHAGTSYNVQLAAGVISDKAGNPFAGITTASALNFTVAGIQSVLTGKAIDGYLMGATVFADANGNGKWDAGEAKATTNEKGEFVLTGAKGALVISGGTDLSTGKAFEGVLKAPEASEGTIVVTPLTTLQQGFIDNGQTVAEAEKSVAQAFGFDETKIDFKTYDPIVELSKTETAGTSAETKAFAAHVMASSAQVANFLVTSTQTMQGAAGGSENLSTHDVGAGLIKALVAQIDAGIKAAETAPVGSTTITPFKLDLGDAVFLKNVLIEGAKETNNRIAAVLPEGTALPELPKFDPTVFLNKMDKMADNVVTVLKDAADNIDNARTHGGNAVDLLTNFNKVSAFVQNDAGKALQDAATNFNPVTDATGDAFKALMANFSGDKADALITAKVDVNPFQGLPETSLAVIKDLAGFITPVFIAPIVVAPPVTGTGGSGVSPLPGTLPPAGTGTVPPTTGGLTPAQQAAADALAAQALLDEAAAQKVIDDAAAAKKVADAAAQKLLDDAAAAKTASDALHGTISSPLATTGTAGDDFLNATRGTITGTATEYTLAGNDQYIFTTTGATLSSVNVKISSFGAGDKLVFDVTTTSTGLATVDALYAVSDNGTDVKLIANQAGNVQYITLVGASSLASDSIDSVTELGTALGSNSILFI